MNVSIKDMNKAFKDQILKLKEKQDEDDCSYISSFQNITGNDNLNYIEISYTPD